MKISIPEPCNEDWNAMTPVDFQQRHCAACDRTLTDFTAMTDAEIGRYLRSASGKICGHFRVSQLDRKLALKGPRSYGGIRAAAAAAGLLLTIPAVGQSIQPTVYEQLMEEPAENGLVQTQEGSVSEVRDSILLSGQITDKTGETLVGVSILIEETIIGTTTDIDGRFSLRVSTDSPISLIVRYTGFINTGYDISVEEMKQGTLLNTTLELDAIICEESASGYIVTNRYLSLHNLVTPVRRYVIWPAGRLVKSIKDWRTSRFDRREARRLRREERQVARTFELNDWQLAPAKQTAVTVPPKEVAPATLNFKASPNPFNNHLRVSFSLAERGDYRMELYNSSGKLVKNWEGVGEVGPQERVLDHQLNNLPAGMYFLELTTKAAASLLTLVR